MGRSDRSGVSYICCKTDIAGVLFLSPTVVVVVKISSVGPRDVLSG